MLQYSSVVKEQRLFFISTLFGSVKSWRRKRLPFSTRSFPHMMPLYALFPPRCFLSFSLLADFLFASPIFFLPLVLLLFYQTTNRISVAIFIPMFLPLSYIYSTHTPMSLRDKKKQEVKWTTLFPSDYLYVLAMLVCSEQPFNYKYIYECTSPITLRQIMLTFYRPISAFTYHADHRDQFNFYFWERTSLMSLCSYLPMGWSVCV